MRNFLATDWRSAAEIENRYDCNLQGGVALWTLPPMFTRAFNPIIFTRTRYYFATDGYTPTRGPRPNRAALHPATGAKAIHLDYPADTDLYVQVTTGPEHRSVLIPKGSREAVTIAAATAIDGFQQTPQDEAAAQYRTAGYVYLAPGEEYKDANYLVASNGAVLYAIDEVDTSYLDVYRADGTVGAKLSAESFRGITTFDVSAVVRLWFAPQLADSAPDTAPATAAYADGRLFTQFGVKGVGGAGTSYDFLALNAVAQVGEDSNMGGYRGQLLSERPQLRKYAGFPLDYSVLDERDAGIQGAGVIRMPVPGDGLIRPDDYGVTVALACVPAQPFYVRWINRLGGVEYFMFGRRQTRKASVKSVNTYDLYAPDPYGATTNRRPYAATTENTVTAGAAGVPEAEYEVLAGLPFAPTIERYDERRMRWTELTVSKFEGTKDTGSATHDIEIVFNLPGINIQF